MRRTPPHTLARLPRPPLTSSHPTPHAAPVAAADEGTFFDLTAIDISGQPHPFEQYRGNVVLAVNVATD